MLRKRVLAMPPAEVEGTHNTDQGFKRRITRYRAENKADKGETAVSVLETCTGTEALMVEVRADRDERDILDNICVYVERRGRPNNFHPTSGEAAAARTDKDTALEAAETKKQSEDEEDARVVAERIAKLEDEQRRRLEEVASQEDALLAVRSMPLRSYLMANVMPTLTRGLLEVCRVNPKDPIDYLAEWLFKHNPMDSTEPPSDDEADFAPSSSSSASASAGK